MKKYALLGMALLLAACTSAEKTSTDLNTIWMGRSYDEFVIEHGVAKANQKLQNGTIMYLWEENTLIRKYGGNLTIPATCKLNILVSSSNVIQNIKVAGSTEGCDEIF